MLCVSFAERGDSYAHSYCDRDVHANGNCDVHAYRDGYIHAYCDGYVHTYGDCHIHTHGYSHSYIYSNAGTNGHLYAYGYSHLHAYGDCHIHTYSYCYVYADSDCYVHTYGDGDLHADSYSYVYAYRHCDIHTDSDCHSNRNRYGYSYSYSDANTNAASCADGIERYQPDCQQLNGQLDQCPRCEQLPVRRLHEQYFWHLRTGIPESDCRRNQSKRHWSDREHVLLLPCPSLQRQYKSQFQRHQGKDEASLRSLTAEGKSKGRARSPLRAVAMQSQRTARTGVPRPTMCTGLPPYHCGGERSFER